MIDIAVADDSQAIRDLLDAVLRFESGLRLIASFPDGREIVEWTLAGGLADVFIIDMRLPGLSGTATIRAINKQLPDVNIIAFSASAQTQSVRAALKAGASTYLVKDGPLQDLMDAIKGDSTVGLKVLENAEPVSPAMKVLVVDDHELMRSATETLLSAAGCETVCAATGAAAIQLIEDGYSPDVALVDLRLDDINGQDLVPMIRSASRSTAVVIHSGSPDADIERSTRESSADAFLIKGSYSMDEMVGTLRSAVANHRPSTKGT